MSHTSNSDLYWCFL